MSVDEPVRAGRVTIPAAELEWRFDTAGGPGGQHANKAATRAEVSWNAGASPSISDGDRDRLLKRLGHRAIDGVVTASSGDSRSQWRNRAIARSRLSALIADALAPPPPPRRRTKPSHAAKRRRLEAKRRRSETKRLRKEPPSE